MKGIETEEKSIKNPVIVSLSITLDDYNAFGL